MFLLFSKKKSLMSQRNPACNPIKKKGVRLDFSIEYKKSFNPIQNIFGRVKDGLD